MPSLVADFIINPVLRQARRFSSGIAPVTPEDVQQDRLGPQAETDVENAISEEFEGSPDSTSIVARPEARETHANEPVDDTRQSTLAGLTLANLDQTEAIVAPDTPATPARRSMRMASNDSAQQARQIPSAVRRGSSDDAQTTSPPIRLPWEGLPENDGMGMLRSQIVSIHARSLSASEKARLMHELLMENYNRSKISNPNPVSSRPATPASPSVWQQPIFAGPLESLKFWNGGHGESSTSHNFNLTEEDLRPTYAPPVLDEDGDEGNEGNGEDDAEAVSQRLGCAHYMRNVKLQCATCERWYTCRFCHDQAEDHVLPRRQTRYMLCMLCGCAQKAGETCAQCGESAARYYCNICKLWNNDPKKSVYHCGDCGICRVGQGLGKDFFHCKQCRACLAIAMEPNHKCIERVTDCDCPICGENMFSSPLAVIFMSCGHSIHRDCYKELLKTTYKCPICSKSVVNMAIQFRNLELDIESQPMPPQFQDTRAIILCNDCSAKSSTKYHWLGLKCGICKSFNTVQLRLLKESDTSHDDTELARPTEEATAPTETHEHSELPPRAMAIPFGRRTTNRPEPTVGSHQGFRDFSPLIIPERLARSVSPTPTPGLAEPADDSDEDLIHFWGRDEAHEDLPAGRTRSLAGEQNDSEESEDDEDEEEEEEEEEEEISLFGHR